MQISEYFTRLSSQFAFPCVHLLLTFVIPSFDFPNVFNSITLLDLESPQTIRNRKKMAHLLPLASQHNLTVNSVFQGVHDLALGINAGSVWRRSDLMRELRFVLSVKSNVSMIGCVSPQDNTPEEIHKLLTSAAYMIESQNRVFLAESEWEHEKRREYLRHLDTSSLEHLKAIRRNIADATVFVKSLSPPS
eukprot:TRINITY_DN1516_c0_g1_i3.p1 TRINITY_DN1516_c0_g1~~TRINITY_DN1516_c0_g1_i3.p1  ORF type:complete len:191 (-),score=41.52 TRINITY_DN1516_c0_g1_i3:123-695(-)